MAPETFYKVCSLQQIFDIENGRILNDYFSLNRRRDCILKYEPGKTTKAPKGTALFAFENFSDAEEYLNSFKSIASLAILKGTGTRYKYKIPDKIPAPWATYYFKEFWKRIKSSEEYPNKNIAHSELMNTPTKVVFLSSFKPLQVVLRHL